MIKLSEIKKVCYKGYYYIVNQVEGQNFLGRPDTKLGWLVHNVTDKALSKSHKITKADWTIKGIEYPPFTAEEANTFLSMGLKKLGKLTENSKDRVYE